jgi:hypothetical protein
MSRNDEFLKILSVLVSQPSSGDPSPPESSAEDAQSPDAARAAKGTEEKKGRGARP